MHLVVFDRDCFTAVPARQPAMLSTVVSLLVVFAALVYLLLRRRLSYWRRCGVTGPAPSLPFGTFNALMGGSKGLGDIVTEIYEK